MAARETRTLSITATVQDFMTRNLTVMSRSVRAFSRVATTALRSITHVVSPLSLAVTGFATAWATIKGGKTVIQILEGVDALNKLGDALNTTVDDMLALQGAFELNNVDSERFARIMRSLGRAIGGATDEDTGRLVDGLRAMGIAVGDLRNLNAVQIFDQIAKGLERYGTASEKSAALSRVFARDFQVMFATLGLGQAEFRKLIETAEFFVGAVGEKGAAAADRFADAVLLMRKALESVGRQAFIKIAEDFAPALERIAIFVAENREVIAKSLAALITQIIDVLAKLGVIFLRVVQFIVTHMEEIKAAIAGVINFFALLVDIVLWFARTIGKALPDVGDKLVEAFGGKRLSEAQQRIRDEAIEVAKTLADLQSRLQMMSRMPEEFDPLGNRIPQMIQEAKDLENQLYQLDAAFDAAADSVMPNVDLVKIAQDAAAIDQLSDSLEQLLTGDFPALTDIDVGLIRALLWGEEGPDKVEEDLGDFFDRFGTAAGEVRDEWTKFGEAGREAAISLLDGGLNGLTDAFADIVTRTKTAKEAFSDYARSMLAELARIISKLALMQIISSLFGLEDGGVVEGGLQTTAPVRRFARGGIARQPTIGIFGEGKRAEAFVPLPDNRSIPVTFTGAGQGGGGNAVNIFITAMDSKDVTRVLIEQQATLQSIWMRQAERRTAMRQIMGQAAR